MDTTIKLLMMAILASFGGYIGGVLSERNRWRRNADDIQRIECMGRLYKVLHGRDYNP